MRSPAFLSKYTDCGAVDGRESVVYVYGSKARSEAEMADDDRSRFMGRSLRVFQANIQRAGPIAAASYALVGAILVLGGLGYVCDRWLGTSPWGAVVGLLSGIVLGFYQLVKAVQQS